MFSAKLKAKDDSVELVAIVSEISAKDVSAISLNLKPDEVFSYQRQLDTLIVVLDNGETLHIKDFFQANGNVELYLSDDGEISEVEINLSDSGQKTEGTYNLLTPSGEEHALVFNPEIAPIPVTAAAGAAGAEGAASAGTLAGVGAIAGVGVIAVLATGSDNEPPDLGAANNGDNTPQDAAIIENATSSKIRGTAEPGSVVEVTVGGVLYTTTASELDGNWSITPEAPDTFETGEPVSVVVIDPEGNTSEPVTGTIGTTEPNSAMVETASGTEVSGTAEPGSVVEVTVGGVLYTTTASEPDGNWSVTPEAPDTFETGEPISVVVI
nr:BapA prefix-like domain-containing protein [Gammaproteobacteria bacterium]